ncbi:MFS general substrate transporter [Auriscalpium vulgare]|uniref:MFS general substrate transporter n=1 Tax=Auriscalpium vulgare TaxID=40419 RepID=A0ACB8RDI6_9AGAM|nr:MFS general substrate transporter [Auriscalpium vulgare]
MSLQYHDPNQRQPSSSRPRSEAWTTLFSAWLTIAASSGYAFSVGAYQDMYTREHGASAKSVHWIGAIQLFLILVVSLPAGMQHDSGHFDSLCNFGPFIFACGIVLLSMNESDFYDPYLAYAQSIAIGVGAGMVYVPYLSAQADRPRSMLAMGIASSGLFVGGTVFPLILQRLLHDGVAFADSATLSLFLAIDVLVVAIFCSLPGPLPADEKPTDVKELVTDAPYMCVAIGGLFLNLGIYFAYVYLQLFVIDHGMDHTFAVHTITTLCGAAIPGCILSALAAEKMGTMNVFTASAFCCTGMLTCAFLPATSIAGVFAALFGFFLGAWFSLLPAVFIQMRESIEGLGTRMGFAFAVGSVAVFTGTPIYDQLLRSTPQWTRLLAFSAVVRNFLHLAHGCSTNGAVF